MVEFGDTAEASRGQLDKFLGLPTDAGLSHVAPARDGGTFEGTRVTAGRVEGPLGGSAAFVSGTHVGYVPPNVRSAQGWTVRNAFYRHNLFTPDWYTAHRRAWTAAALAGSAWAPASWSSAADWVGCDFTARGLRLRQHGSVSGRERIRRGSARGVCGPILRSGRFAGSFRRCQARRPSGMVVSGCIRHGARSAD